MKNHKEKDGYDKNLYLYAQFYFHKPKKKFIKHGPSSF